jgi:hypothetical protein
MKQQVDGEEFERDHHLDAHARGDAKRAREHEREHKHDARE